MNPFTHGFMVSGGSFGPRVPVHAGRAFAGFAACDACARVGEEHYLSAFTFGREFTEYLRSNGSVRGYIGPCSGNYLWWDIDRENDIATALADTRALCLYLNDGWHVPEPDTLVFFSGSKGFHVGVPTALWSPEPSADFNRIARRLAERIAGKTGGNGIVIDTGIYDKVRIFRAPNSRHPKTGLHKRRLTVDELLGLSIERIVALAQEPLPFDIPSPSQIDTLLAEAWTEERCAEIAHAEAVKKRAEQLRASGGPTRLNSLSLDFIRDGADKGGAGTAPEAGRHQRLFAAACNLGEFGCPLPLALALLEEPALDCGIRPTEVRRTIENGLKHAAEKGAGRG